MADPIGLVERLAESSAFEHLSPPLQTALFLGGMVLLPAAMVCLTPFTRIVIVLSFVRRAVTAQDIPPNTVIIGLSMFLTLFVMRPTWDQMSERAITPYMDGKMKGVDAFRAGTACLQDFMLRQTRRQDLALFIHRSGGTAPERPADTPFHLLVPAFVISELKTAFVMGFCIYMPFLLVDLVVSTMLTSMGMMMMPPVLISAPFKILLFALADGWHLVARALSLSFG